MFFCILFFIVGFFISKINSGIFLLTYLYPGVIWIIFITIVLLLWLIRSYRFISFKISFLFPIYLFFLIWGISHSAPELSDNISWVYVLKTGLGSGFSNMIVMDQTQKEDNKRVYEVSGSFKNSREGSIRCFSHQQIFLKRSNCIFISRQRTVNITQSLIDRWNNTLKQRLLLNLRSHHLRENFIHFITGILYGDKEGIPLYIKDQFRSLGIYHLLVISGLHFALIASCIRFFLFLGIKVLYALRLISPSRWIRLSMVVNIFVCLGVVGFMGLASISGAGQRAGIIFITHILTPYISGVLPLRSRVLLCFLIQILVFPLGIFSLGTLISWIAYLCFVSLSTLNKKTSYSKRRLYALWGTLTERYLLIKKIGEKVGKLLIVQIKLTTFSSCVFSLVSPLSIFINIVLVPIFPVVMLSAIYLGVFENSGGILDQLSIGIITLWFKIIWYLSILDRKMREAGFQDFLSSSIYKVVIISLGIYFLLDLISRVFFDQRKLKL